MSMASLRAEQAQARGARRESDPVNLGKVGDVELMDVPALADTDVGVEPVEYNLIIAPARQRDKVGSIFIPDESRESLELARQVGRIVAASEIAFNYDAWPADGRGPPKVGDIVWFARYAGGVLDGEDGKPYRMVKDKDIGGIVRRWGGPYPEGFTRFGRDPRVEQH